MVTHCVPQKALQRDWESAVHSLPLSAEWSCALCVGCRSCRKCNSALSPSAASSCGRRSAAIASTSAAAAAVAALSVPPAAAAFTPAAMAFRAGFAALAPAGSLPSAPLTLVLALLACGAHAWPFPQAPAGHNEGDACRAPDGRAGVCRAIGSCPPLLALLTGRPSQAQIILLNRARCGFQGSVPVVCCADASSPPSPSPPPSPPPPASPAPWGEEAPTPVRGHPNLPLLPMDTCSPGAADRLVGGKTADLFAYPWMARLGYRQRSRPTAPPSYRCGGSLISERYVLTAAHCVAVRDFRVTTVRLGEHTVDTPIDCRKNSTTCLPLPLDIDVEEAIPHEAYDKTKMHHDIALLRLARRVDLAREEFVRPVCLPVSAANQRLPPDGHALTVAGWGTTETGDASNALLDVVVPAVPLSTCRDAYRKVRRAPEGPPAPPPPGPPSAPPADPPAPREVPRLVDQWNVSTLYFHEGAAPHEANSPRGPPPTPHLAPSDFFSFTFVPVAKITSFASRQYSGNKHFLRLLLCCYLLPPALLHLSSPYLLSLASFLLLFLYYTFMYCFIVFFSILILLLLILLFPFLRLLYLILCSIPSPGRRMLLLIRVLFLSVVF